MRVTSESRVRRRSPSGSKAAIRKKTSRRESRGFFFFPNGYFSQGTKTSGTFQEMRRMVLFLSASRYFALGFRSQSRSPLRFQLNSVSSHPLDAPIDGNMAEPKARARQHVNPLAAAYQRPIELADDWVSCSLANPDPTAQITQLPNSQ